MQTPAFVFSATLDPSAPVWYFFFKQTISPQKTYGSWSHFLLLLVPGLATLFHRIGNQNSEFQSKPRHSASKSRSIVWNYTGCKKMWPQRSGFLPHPSASAWERGISSPSRRMKKEIWEFLDYSPKLIPKIQRKGFFLPNLRNF